MNDQELLAEFTEIRKVPNGIALRVRHITWPHSHTPRARWHTVATFPMSKGIQASGYEDAKGFVVMKGSACSGHGNKSGVRQSYLGATAI